MQKNHLYSVFFAPRGLNRISEMGMQIAQNYLTPFDQIIGLVGESGSGKSMIIKGMFPGLELTNDDAGVNVRPLPLLAAGESQDGFYTPHTYHVDIRFESAFTQLHELAKAIKDVVELGKRVIVEHFEMIYPFLEQNAHLLIGIGEEIIVTRPTLFGPEPQDIANIVFKSMKYRRMTHTAEDLCSYYMVKAGITEKYLHSDVRHGFVFSFAKKPDIDLEVLENQVNDAIKRNIPIAYCDESHIRIDGDLWGCSGPRFHVRSAGEIKKFTLAKDFAVEPITERYLMVGVVGENQNVEHRLSDLNKI